MQTCWRHLVKRGLDSERRFPPRSAPPPLGGLTFPHHTDARLWRRRGGWGQPLRLRLPFISAQAQNGLQRLGALALSVGAPAVRRLVGGGVVRVVAPAVLPQISQNEPPQRLHCKEGRRRFSSAVLHSCGFGRRLCSPSFRASSATQNASPSSPLRAPDSSMGVSDVMSSLEEGISRESDSPVTELSEGSRNINILF